MPKVFGNVMNVAGIPLDGTVWVSSPEWRPGGTSLITMNRETYQVVGGVFETDDLVPGHVMFEFRGDGAGQVRRKEYAVVLQDSDDNAPVDFLDLVESGYEYPQEVVGQAQAAARESRRWAEESESSFQSSKALYGDLSAVNAARAASEAARDSSRSARDVAIAKRDEAEGFAGSASDDADRAEAAAGSAAADTEELLSQHVADSRAARDAAAGSASDASSSATGAAGSAAASAGSAAEAVVARQGAETAQGEAEVAADRSAAQADDASDYADDASASATVASDNAILSGQNAAAAEVSAGNAQDAADEAADDVRSTLQGFVTSATASKDAAKTSETNAKASEDAARQSAADAAEAVASGVADATVDSKGKLRLAGDLGGTADAPTVPGLAGKSNTGHTHLSSEVDGLDPIIATVNAATYQPEASTLMRRTSSGRVSVAAPSEAANAANKQYVDQAVLTKVDTTSTGNRLYGTNAGGSQTQLTYANAATANTIPYRGTNGTLPVGAPTSGEHAATKTYVDDAVATRATPAQVNARPAMWLWSGEGTWSPPAGLVGTDSVLNLKTGDILPVVEVV
ncbi:hypothetical protein [Corynebacterium sp. CNJ-954]|uniref:hypothetical protein n=1 Tax=Corynebacterium sp. CNJ-954 TaxID=1904962 RepID=UPI00130186B7|nr:hypothetical protein [Corynebacterium sp. CNJ-954]